ncbi:hypothetical protein J6590_077923 [Homalodisca vitripennis]|nr:hypothetical protein J6590_077923 [Homalodisca vitripennis]
MPPTQELRLRAGTMGRAREFKVLGLIMKLNFKSKKVGIDQPRDFPCAWCYNYDWRLSSYVCDTEETCQDESLTSPYSCPAVTALRQPLMPSFGYIKSYRTSEQYELKEDMVPTEAASRVVRHLGVLSKWLPCSRDKLHVGGRNMTCEIWSVCIYS